MTLTISKLRDDPIGVDFHGVTPETLRGLSLDDVRRTIVLHGNRRIELGELFAVEGDPADAEWRLSGDFSTVHGIGSEMAAGEIVVEGNVGRHAGAAMRGGRIEIHGDAADWLGAAMQGGAIRVRGNAGDDVGAAYPGEQRGMRGGAILIDRSAGSRLGARMRRGLIAVAGDADSQVGLGMLAGSIFVFGKCGERMGMGMRRGTIGLFGKPPKLLPTFRRACRRSMEMLRLIERRLRQEGFAEQQLSALTNDVELWHGDFLQSGRGEILLAT